MTDTAENPPTVEPPAPSKNLWYAQASHGGIPEDPELFESRSDAERRFAEMTVARGIAPLGKAGESDLYRDDLNCDPNGGYAGNDDDDDVRWGEVEVYPTLAARGPCQLDADQLVEVGRILGYLHAQAQAAGQAPVTPKA